MDRPLNCIILGAAGRDFHDAQTFFKDNPRFRLCCFTATQIPFIEKRAFPRELMGKGYEEDIPIHLEKELPELIERYDADFVFLAYSDLPHAEVMHKASLVQSCGAAFALLGPKQTQLQSRRPVVSVTAVRTGSGKSPLTQLLARHLRGTGRRVGVLRHPMPYGDLRKQVAERMQTAADLDRYECTIEEREEYAPYVEMGLPIFAGVDYAAILKAAEAESDVVLWDGGNNDYSFLRPDVSLVVADALRPGHEMSFYPGETNLRAADLIVISKVKQASAEDVALIRRHAAGVNPDAAIVEADLALRLDEPEKVKGKKVLVIEDGPTVTHGGMAYGAGYLAAKAAGVAAIVDPRKGAVGSIARSFAEYPHLKEVLPALGYSEEQRQELAQTIRRSGAEVVIDASPARMGRVLQIDQPVVRVEYAFEQVGGPPLLPWVMERLHAAELARGLRGRP